MTFDDDRQWAKDVLGAADPAATATTINEDDVRAAVAPRTPELSRRRLAGDTRGRDSTRRALTAVAAALVLLMVAMPVVAVASDPAWAVERQPDGRVRVEYSSLLGHGPDPQGLVDALRDHGVEAHIRRVPRLSPLTYGRIVGIETTFTARGARLADGLPDPARYGMHDIERGYVLDPEPFRNADGTIIIQVATPPWSV